MINRSFRVALMLPLFVALAFSPGQAFAISCGDAQCEPEEGETCDTCPVDCGCLEGFMCVGGECVEACVPDCEGKECGPDGCGGVCGECEPGLFCNGGSCMAGESCGELIVCSVGCVTLTGPQCLVACLEQGSPEAKELFGALTVCLVAVCGVDIDLDCLMTELTGQCQGEYDACMGCDPDCDGKMCGDDGCDGSCGECAGAEVCDDNQCVPECVPDCVLKTCGDDGCGGSCGECEPGYICDMTHCVETCIPECADKECGDDGCGAFCGVCGPGEKCQQDQCICMADCTGKECGSDGCGGMCGLCPPNENCQNGLCVGGGSGLGCEPTGFAGCGGCACEGCVCAMDPYCCDISWDSICADECVGQCGGCGGGTVQPGCVPTDYPGCGGCACESCVCNLDAWCCDINWDSICVDECQTECGGCGEMPENCGDGMCDWGEGENCSTCVPDCGCASGQMCQEGTCVEAGCAESDFPGCGGCSCEGCVCGMDSFCCQIAWDALCVG